MQIYLWRGSDQMTPTSLTPNVTHFNNILTDINLFEILCHIYRLCKISDKSKII
jgi:hypothetical protein